MDAIAGRAKWQRFLGYAAAVVLLACCAVAAFAIFMDERQSDQAAGAYAGQLAEAERQLGAGDADSAMQTLWEAADTYSEAPDVEDPAKILATLEKFPAETLAGTAEKAGAKGDAGLRWRALCLSALVVAYPETAQGASARETLMAMLEKGELSSLVSGDLFAVDALASDTSDAWVQALEAPLTDERPDGDPARVLSRMGPKGWEVLLRHLPENEENLIGDPASEALATGKDGVADAVIPVLSDASAIRRRAAAGILAKIAGNSSRRDAKAAAQALRDAIGDPVVAMGAVEFFIMQGKPGTESTLVAALRQAGTKADALAMLNSGNAELERAAREWADEHGYTIETVPAGGGATWGGD